MLDMTLIKERQEEARAEPGIMIQELVADIDDLIEEVVKTPWRVRDLIGTGRIIPDWQAKTPFRRLCNLTERIGRLSMSVADDDNLMTELFLGEVAILCIDWMKELEHARLGAD